VTGEDDFAVYRETSDGFVHVGFASSDPTIRQHERLFRVRQLVVSRIVAATTAAELADAMADLDVVDFARAS
jgi:hypothetical protein